MFPPPTLGLPEYFHFLLATIVPGFTLFMCLHYLLGLKKLKWKQLGDAEKLFLAMAGGFLISLFTYSSLAYYLAGPSFDIWEQSKFLEGLSLGGLFSTCIFLSIFMYPWYFKFIYKKFATSGAYATLGYIFPGMLSASGLSLVVSVLVFRFITHLFGQIFTGMTFFLIFIPMFLVIMRILIEKLRMQGKKRRA